MDKKKLIFIICGIVIAISVAIIGIGVAMYFISNKDADSATATTENTAISTDAISTTSSNQNSSASGFDIEVVRKNIIVKGHQIQIPTTLAELGEGWSFSDIKNPIPDSEYYSPSAKVLYNNEQMFTCGLKNYDENNLNDAIIFNMTIKTEDSSIDGLIPKKTTVQEVIKKYGQPNDNKENTWDGSGDYFYYYGNLLPNGKGGGNKGQKIAITFNKDGIIKILSVTYNE